MKKCLRCAAQNGDEYCYCRLCGAILPEIEAAPYNGESDEEGQERVEDSLSRISTFEMETFVGKNSEDIVKRFIFMHKTGRKAGFYLPPFLLGLFFGMPGLAVWFLYRKMTKPAVILLLGAAVLRTVGFTAKFQLSSLWFRMALRSIGTYIRSGSRDLSGLLEHLLASFRNFTEGNAALGVARYAVTALTLIFFALFALALYKKHCQKRILALKSAATDKSQYIKALKAEGGVSVGRAVAGSVIYLSVFLLQGLVLLVYCIIAV